MYPYLKDVSIDYNFNQKQHVTCVHVDEAHVAQLIYMIILHLQIFFSFNLVEMQELVRVMSFRFY
jgi:hypothetical protein